MFFNIKIKRIVILKKQFYIILTNLITHKKNRCGRFAIFLKKIIELILNNIIKLIKEHMLFVIAIYGLMMASFIFIVFLNVKSRFLQTLYIINTILTFICLCFLCRAIKRSDSYTIDYITAVFIYILMVIYFSYLNQTHIYKEFDSKTKSNINNLIPFFIQILLVALVEWTLFYIIKIKEKNKKIDETEFTIVFFKSILESLTSSIAIIGLTGWGLKGTNLVILVFIDAYAAFSYPILDLNKYEREKEIEYFEKNFAPIRPIDESKD